ncbi:MAG: hypothetical protein IJX56_00985, partial [Alistipes sp.]|nr:hypothetical protein [Alistipes sp.]
PEGEEVVVDSEGNEVSLTQSADGSYNVYGASGLEYLAGTTVSTEVKLVADIDMKGAEMPWILMKDATFDGNGMTIKNVVTKSSDPTYSNGLFNPYSSGDLVVKNLYIETVNVTSKDPAQGNGFCGVIFGAVNEYCTSVTIENVHIVDATILGTSNVGGFVGYSIIPVTIKNCSISDSMISNIAVSGESGNVGGLVGRMNGANLTIGENVKLSNVTIDGYWATRRGAESISELVGNCVNGAQIVGTPAQTDVNITRTEVL